MPFPGASALAKTMSTVACALVLSACSATPGQGGAGPMSPPKLTNVPVPTSQLAAELALPLSAYDPSTQVTQVIVRASHILQAKCMAAHGYTDFTAAADVTAGPPTTAGDRGGPFGYLDAARAAQYGFHPGGSQRPPLPAGGMRSASEAEASLRCMAQARAQLLGASLASSSRLIQAVAAESEQDTAADPRVITATKAWASCMKAKGFDDTSPANLAQGPWAGPKPTATEIATAEADASCTRSANLGGIYFAVLAGYQRELISRSASAFAAIHRQNSLAAARAAKAIGGGS